MHGSEWYQGVVCEIRDHCRVSTHKREVGLKCFFCKKTLYPDPPMIAFTPYCIADVHTDCLEEAQKEYHRCKYCATPLCEGGVDPDLLEVLAMRRYAGLVEACLRREWLKLVPPRRVEGGTLVFDVNDLNVQLPGEIKYDVIV